MKKIAILTQPLHNNYGGLLQNFALQAYLKQNGYLVSTINLKSENKKYSFFRIFAGGCKRFLLRVLGDESILFLNIQKQVCFLNSPGKYQKRFIDEHIDYITIDKILTPEFDTKHNFEAYIVGSDQVWRPRFSPFLKNYYLDFLENKETKKISYSASFGVDNWEASEEITPDLSKYAKMFDNISVREDSAISLCNKYLGVEAKHTLDPTMLFGANFYKNLVKEKKENSEIGKDKVCMYVLDMNNDNKSIVNEICDSKNLQIHRIGKPERSGFPSVESWINGFDKADYIVTDSFHGTIFSILFNKPFICLGNKGRGSTRFTSLLKIFDLSHKLIDSYGDFKNRKSEILSDIDYESVNRILEQKRKESELFLKDSLK